MAGLQAIEHLVVLMLENRSFDNMLGKLYPKSSAFDGLSGDEFNFDASGNRIRIANRPGKDQTSLSVPDPDPGELWLDINTQLFGSSNVPNPTPDATMNGFVQSYIEQAKVAPGTYDPKAIMNYFTPEQVPVLSRLARQFAVCDRWFASAPCQTWPNRFFLHTGTANGYENNDPPHFPYEMETIFNRFELAGMEDGWRIYYHDFAQTWALSKLWLLLDHFRFYEQFREDAKSGSLPAYAFIEPRYYPHAGHLPNDQHPPHNVALGEQLIADVYNCLRSGPKWTKTLLIIIYDEHGGCYDHVAPPRAEPPAPLPTARFAAPFAFDRYGVRVPAVIVSPYIRQGTVLRPPAGHPPFDHTSVLATLRRRYPELGLALTKRDEVAPDLASALTLNEPTNLGPSSLDAISFTPSPAQVATAQLSPPNGMQRALANMAAHFPGVAPADDAVSFLANHIHDLSVAPAPLSIPAHVDATSTAAAAAFIKSATAPFLATFTTATSGIAPVIDDTEFRDAEKGLALPTRQQNSGGRSLSIGNLDRADPPAPYKPDGFPRAEQFNRNVLSITSIPKMPEIEVRCNVVGFDPAVSPVHWRLQSLYVVGRYRKVSGGSMPHYRSRVLALPDEWTGKSSSATFTLFAPDPHVTYDNQSGRVAGGHAILTIAACPPGSDWLVDFVHLRIGGTNPSEANVRAFVADALSGRDPNIVHMADAVFSHENLMQQFDKLYRTGETYRGTRFDWPHDPANFPAVAFDFGIGLGQFTHPGEETISICWDWRENLKAGINELLSDLGSTFARNLSWRDWAVRAWSTYNAGSATSAAGLEYARKLMNLPDGQLISAGSPPPGFDPTHQTAAVPQAPSPPAPGPWPLAQVLV